MGFVKEPTESVKELTSADSIHDGRRPLPAKTWPVEPAPLSHDREETILNGLYDAVLICVPLVLVAKIGLIIYAWWNDRSHSGYEIDQASFLTLFLIDFNGQLTTAFTIVFATVMATLVRRYALWRAQNGASLSDLEQFQGSTSLPSTAKLIWSLRAFNSKSLVLICIWSFYYLGSQASKSEYQKVPSRMQHRMSAAMMTASGVSGLDPKFHPATTIKQAHEPWHISTLNSYYAAADNLLDPSQIFSYDPLTSSIGTDASGSPLIPSLEQMTRVSEGDYYVSSNLEVKGPYVDGSELYKFEKHRHGWVDVSVQSNLVGGNFHTAMVGRPIWTTQEKSGQSFLALNNLVGEYTTNVSYLSVTCGKYTNHTYDSFPSGTFLNQSVSINMTQPGPDAHEDRFGNKLREFDVWFRWQKDPANQFDYAGSGKQTCNIRRIAIELHVHCLGGKCFSHRARFPNGGTVENATSFSTPFDDEDFAASFFSNLLLARGPQYAVNQPAVGLTGNLWKYMGGPEPPQMPEGGYCSVLTQHINTYYLVSQSPKLTGYLPSKNVSSPIWPDPNWTCLTGESSDPNYSCFSVHGAHYEPHFGIFWHWIAIDFMSCCILFVAAIVAHLLRRKTIAPDIFGYVSTLTLNNPHIDLPDSGTTLSGIQRARLLKGLKVKIGDISGDDTKVGKVGLARADSEFVKVQTLRRSTAYV